MGIKERQERDREAVHRSILDAARELFTAEGYRNVSIRKIAERIEYSPAAIYSYFPSKDDIFFALAEEGFRLLGGPRHPAHRAELASLPPYERLRSIFWHFWEFSRQQPQYFALMFVDRDVPRISKEYERFAFAQDLKLATIEEIRQCIDSGALSPTVDPGVAMRTISCSLIGVATLALSDRLGPDEDADQLASNVLEIALAGLKSGITLHPVSVPDCSATLEEPVR
jgi:AcrR family transcriptional regulator